mmetsp:Transcript_32948/g.57775  ORF Transcript_32948/g.57775 Transcript_32948/m.57775 type:complete len:183 (+) Transcript_32948:7269-7817(+)
MDMLERGQFSEPSTLEHEGMAFPESFMWMIPQLHCEDQDQFRHEPGDGNPDSSLFAFDQMFGGSEVPMMPNPMEYFQAFFSSDQFGAGKMQFPMMHTLPKPMLYPSAKKIGTLSIEERRMKVHRFLEKRKKRNFSKKVSYDCRKRVADNRIRVKGRFITKSHAETILSNQVKSEDEPGTTEL